MFIVLAYFTFDNPRVERFVNDLEDLKYLGIFIAGIFFSFGFTAPFAAGFFITSNPGNVLVAGIVGGCGALIADLIIFNFVRSSFQDEFNRLKKNNALLQSNKWIEKRLGRKVMVYLMYVFAGFLIASPLPDEAGMVMLAGLTKIKTNMVALIGLTLNTLGIILLLLI